jgi:ectoine hydroxylase-related dioxygenase (phytanoyl-CoA dioxygenase family)
MLHCAAPFMGVDTHALVADGGKQRLATCMAWVMLDDCDGLSSALWHLPGSHKVIHAALQRGVRTGGIDVRKLSIDFAAMDSDIAHWLRHFPELEAIAAEEHRVPAGTVVVCDPHLLVSTGPNFTRQTHVSMQMLVASSADTKGSVHPSSWVRAWKAQSKQVDLRNNVIFPPLRGKG